MKLGLSNWKPNHLAHYARYYLTAIISQLILCKIILAEVVCRASLSFVLANVTKNVDKMKTIN